MRQRLRSVRTRLTSALTTAPLPFVKRAVFDDWMWVRGAVPIFCGVGAYLVWLFAFGRAVPERQDMPPLAALAIAIFGLVQVILSWYGVPDPAIEIGSGVRFREKYRIVHVSVSNWDVARWVRPLVSRGAPEGCQVWVRYSRDVNKPVLGWVLGRWNENWEPIDYKEGTLDLRIMLKNRRLERLYPTERHGELPSSPYEIALAIKEDGQEDFCHFNDESYQPQHQPGWRNAAWAMGQGRYKVDVRVRGYGLIRSATATFRLLNEGTSADGLRLEPWT